MPWNERGDSVEVIWAQARQHAGTLVPSGVLHASSNREILRHECLEKCLDG